LITGRLAKINLSAMKKGRRSEAPPLNLKARRAIMPVLGSYMAFFIFVIIVAVTWPRISPPGLAAVCMLTYHLPACRSAACASVKVASPLIGDLVTVIGSPTPALAPASAGPWKWAATASPVRPL